MNAQSVTVNDSQTPISPPPPPQKKKRGKTPPDLKIFSIVTSGLENCVEATGDSKTKKQREITVLGRQGTQQQRPESPAVTLIWYASNYKIHKLHQRCIPSASAVPITFPDGCYQRGVMIVIIVLIPCS